MSIPRYLEAALKDSKDRLLIISPWIRAKVVNPSFVRQLEVLLKRNVKVFIGYGLGQEDEEMNESDRRAEQALRNLADRFSHFRFIRFGDTHSKILISDRKFIVTTSFNWLSFRGDPNRTFRDEQGMFVGLPDIVDRALCPSCISVCCAQYEVWARYAYASLRRDRGTASRVPLH